MKGVGTACLVLFGMTFVALILLEYNPPRGDFASAIAAGKVVPGMNESMVAEVWGAPDHVQASRRTQTGIILPIESYSWVYYEPYRRVTFHTEGYGERVAVIEY